MKTKEMASPEDGLPTRLPPHHVRLGVGLSKTLDPDRVHVSLQLVQVLPLLQPHDRRVENVELADLFPRAAGVGLVEGETFEELPVVLLPEV